MLNDELRIEGLGIDAIKSSYSSTFDTIEFKIAI